MSEPGGGALRHGGRKRARRAGRLRGSIRLRAAVSAMAIAGVALGASAFCLVAVLRSSLYGSATNTAKAEALDIATLVATRGRIPRRLPVSVEEMAAQVVGAGGQILSASPNVAGEGPMALLRPAPGATSTRLGVILDLHVARHPHVPIARDSRFVVAAAGLDPRGVAGAGGHATVLVAGSLGAADHAVDDVALALAAALSGVLVLVGGLVYATTRSALRPVEAIRTEVAALSVSDLHRRVPEPPNRDEIGLLARRGPPHPRPDRRGPPAASRRRGRPRRDRPRPGRAPRRPRPRRGLRPRGRRRTALG